MSAIAAGAAGAAATKAAVAGAAVSGGMQVASGLFKPSIKRQWKYQQRFMELQQRYALEQMAEQYKYWKKQFDEENAYNDPTKVMERFRAAGINPAAVMGQSGASVGATMTPSGMAGMTGTGGSPGLDYSNPFAGAPAAMAEGAMIASNIRRNDAAANADNANAGKLRSETHGEGFQAEADKIFLALQDNARKASEHGITSAEYDAKLKRTAFAIAENDRFISDMTVDYRIDTVKYQLDKLKAEKKSAEAYSEYAAVQAGSDYLLTLAQWDLTRAEEGAVKQSAALTYEQVRNAREMFAQNWETKYEVRMYNKNREVIDTKQMTLQEMYGYLTSIDASEGSLDELLTGYTMRSEKNALGYSLLKALVGIIGAVGVGYATKGKAAPTGYQETVHDIRDNYDAKGRPLGSSQETRTTTRIPRYDK